MTRLIPHRFDGKVAVVTGAASGIGRAITQRWVAEGGRVAAGDVNVEGLASLQGELGDGVATMSCDVTNEAQVELLVSLASTRLGRLDAAFCVAGASRGALIVDMTEEDWDFTVDLCLKGVFLGTKHAARAMIGSGTRGAIVNIASLNSRVPMFFGSAYSAAKAGVVSLGQSAALELAEHGIRVNTVSPGLTDTPMAAPLTGLDSVRRAYMERIPMKRAATPDDIAASSLYLASDDADYVTGVNLFVDGGWEQSGYPDLRPYFPEIMALQEATLAAAPTEAQQQQQQQQQQ
jgi:NAD(P)-dependent dehydrogenase (short-subunit alcohol dehydrogenase family)